MLAELSALHGFVMPEALAKLDEQDLERHSLPQKTNAENSG